MTSWQESIGRLADKKWKESLEQGVLEYISTLPDEKPLLVACSGGADSVFLTLAMLLAIPGAARRLHIVHFNHGLRGPDSDADENFVQDLAEELGIPCHIGHPGKPLEDDEASLREARYTWMTEKYRVMGAGGLLLGHHADDVVESLLMAVLTGAGPAGLAAPMPVKRFSDGHLRLRPLLSLKRRQIVEFLSDASIPWREDSSNRDTTYTRNWLRQECIPQLRERIPQDIYSGTKRTRELMEECLQSLDEQLMVLDLDVSDPEELDIRSLAGRPRALIRRAVMSWWLRHFPNETVGKGALETVLRQIQSGESGGPFNMGAGRMLGIEAPGVLMVLRPGKSELTQWGAGAHWNWRSGPLCLPNGASLHAEWKTWTGDSLPPYKEADPQSTAWLRCDESILQVRQWQAGDRYQPLGAPGRRKLQDMFVDLKLPTEQKHKLPVLLDSDGMLLWVPGFPPSEQCRVTRECKSALKLTYNYQSAGLT